MPPTEARLIFIIGVVICVDALVARQSLGRLAVMFPLGCLAGWLAQLALGPSMNLYTANVSLYLWYVSAGIILAWGVGLTSMWALHIALCRLTGRSHNAAMFILSGLPAMWVLEYIGTNVLVMRLHDFHRYQPLMPSVDSMRAPFWLYEYYILVAVLFYSVLTALGINTGDWSRARLAWGRSAAPDGGNN